MFKKTGKTTTLGVSDPNKDKNTKDKNTNPNNSSKPQGSNHK